MHTSQFEIFKSNYPTQPLYPFDDLGSVRGTPYHLILHLTPATIEITNLSLKNSRVRMSQLRITAI